MKSNIPEKKYPYAVCLNNASVPVHAGPGINYVVVEFVSDRNTPQIVEEREDKTGKCWGRLKSGAGWIRLEGTERI